MVDIDGSRLRVLRKARNIKAQEIADLAHVQAPNISRIENNKQKASDGILAAYAKALGIDRAELNDQLSSTQAKFRLFRDVTNFISGNVWGNWENSVTASIADIKADPDVNLAATAHETQQLASLLCQFVTNGGADKRKLTLVFQSPPIARFYPDLHEQLFVRLCMAITRDCPVLYVSVAEPIDRLAHSHLFLKLRLSLFAHNYAVITNDGREAKFRSRSIPRSTRLSTLSTGDKNRLPHTPTAGSNVAVPAVPYDVGYWHGHSLFMAMPVTSIAHPEAGFISHLPSGGGSATPFDLHADFLDAQTKDIQIFSNATELSFWKLFHNLQQAAGDQRMVQSIFTTLTRPAPFYRTSGELFERLCKRYGSEENAAAIVAIRRERTIAFQSQLETRHFRQICDAQAVQQWVSTGLRVDLAPIAGRLDPETLESRRMRLINIIDLLERYEKFEVGISDKYDSEWHSGHAITDNRRLSWISNSNDVLALERQEHDRADLGETRVVIENRSIREEFDRRFDDAWARMGEAEKGKRQVIERLRHWTEELENSH